jgi:pyridinium-3,5-biscarboxylic acid mononucleotide sulfurtransferase
LTGRVPDLHSDKLTSLLSLLNSAGSAVLAFSGGLDSSFLLYAMKLSGMRFLAVTAHSGTMPGKDFEHAVLFGKETGADHLIISTDEVSNESFASNPPDRCFYCKEGLFRKLREIADERGFVQLFDGTNTDDLNDYRPGLKAAALFQVRSPLAESGFSKEDIRTVCRKLGLGFWDRPSSPCLSSRFPYGRRITRSGLEQVAAAEDFLHGLGLKDLRVRHHGEVARIELREEDMHVLFDPVLRKKITSFLKALGFSFVSLDLEEYASGNLNRVLKDLSCPPKKPGNHT